MVRNRLAELHIRTGFEETENTESENQPLKKQFKKHEEEFLNKVGTIWFPSSVLAHQRTKDEKYFVALQIFQPMIAQLSDVDCLTVLLLVERHVLNVLSIGSAKD